MQSIFDIFGDPKKSDPLCRWIPYECFVDESVFSTTTGHIGMTLEMDGVEYGAKPQEAIDSVAERFIKAHRVLDGRFRVYHHLVKRQGEKVSTTGKYPNKIVEKSVRERIDFLESRGLYSVRLFTTIVLESDPVKLTAAAANEKDLSAHLDLQLQHNVSVLKEAVSSYSSALGALLGITILDRAQIFEHLCLLANPEPALCPNLKYNEHLNYFAANTAIEKQTNCLDWGGYSTRVFVMKEEPESTFANMLLSLMRIESNLILAYEWRAESNLAMAQLIRGKRERLWGQRFAATKKAEFAQADKAATEKAERLNDALADMTVNGNGFGHFSMIAVVFDQDEERLRRSVSELNSAFRERLSTLLEERRNRLRSFFSIFPGNSNLNIRYRYLSVANYADMAPLYKSSTGNIYNAHLDEEYLTVLESLDGTPYYFNLHVGQVAASLVSGTTGSGKSMLLNQLIEDSQKNEGQITFVVDIGGSFRAVTKKYGGTYISVSLKEKNFRLNPFSQPYSPDNVNSIKNLILELLANEQYEPSIDEREEIDTAIHEVYSLREGRRRLGAISLSKPLKKALYLWINGGAMAHIFDNEQDDLRVSNFSTWDYTDLEENPEVLRPLMYYQFHWISHIVRDRTLASSPKGLWCDEGWRFAGGPMVDLIRTAAKTWRKHNAWVVFGTQDEIDMKNAGLREVLNAACHTKIYLPNPDADFSLLDSKLTPSEQAAIKGLEIGQMLVKTKIDSRILRLRVPDSKIRQYEEQFESAV